MDFIRLARYTKTEQVINLLLYKISTWKNAKTGILSNIYSEGRVKDFSNLSLHKFVAALHPQT